MLFHDIFAHHPKEREAIIDQDRSVTYGEFQDLVERWAAYFEALGVKKGDRVGLVSKNCLEFIVTYFAVIKAGGVIVPINFQLVPREIAYIVKDTAMKLLVVKEALPLAEPLQELSAPSLMQITFDELHHAPEQEFVPVSLTETDPSTIIYTSGTTGKPKGAMLSHGNLYANARDFMESIPLTAEDTALCVLPMYHCFAWTVCVAGPLLCGGRIVIQAVYQFKAAMRLVKQYGVTMFTGVPAVYRLLHESRDLDSVDSVRYFISGGAPLGLDLARGFALKFGRPVLEGYGLSEASPVVSVNLPHKVKVGSIGPTIAHVKAKIINAHGEEVPHFERGELLVKGPNVMLGYLNLPDATAKAIEKDGWLHTGDVGYMDEDGFIFLVDRVKDMIISSGENVYPREIEEVVSAYPGVAECSVIGIPDALRGQAICLYVVPREGETIDKKALRQYLIGRIAPYKVPREYFLVESLPKTTLGKVRKNVLRDETVAILSKNKFAGRAL